MTLTLKLKDPCVMDTPLASPVVPEDENIPATFSKGSTWASGGMGLSAVSENSWTVLVLADLFVDPMTTTGVVAKSLDATTCTTTDSTVGEQRTILGVVRVIMCLSSAGE